MVGPRVNDMYEAMVFAEEEDKTKWSIVCQKLNMLCARRTSKHVTRDQFFQLKQGGRNVDQFVTEMRKQVKGCEFGSLTDDLMMYVLIRGVDSDRMRRKLLEAENLDLAKAIRLCQITESTTSELQILAGQSTEIKEDVAVISSKTRRSTTQGESSLENKRSDQSVSRDGKGRSQGMCSRCGWSHRPRQCPAFGQQCKKCGRRNHFAKVCRAADTQTHLVEEKRGEPQ